MAGRGQRAQDLRELVGGELAGSTGAVAELGEPAGRDGVDHDRNPRCRPPQTGTSHPFAAPRTPPMGCEVAPRGAKSAQAGGSADRP